MAFQVGSSNDVTQPGQPIKSSLPMRVAGAPHLLYFDDTTPPGGLHSDANGFYEEGDMEMDSEQGYDDEMEDGMVDDCDLLTLDKEGGERPFRFLAASCTHEEFPAVVHSVLDRGRQVDAIKFNMEVFGNRLRGGVEHFMKRVDSRLQAISSGKLNGMEVGELDGGHHGVSEEARMGVLMVVALHLQSQLDKKTHLSLWDIDSNYVERPKFLLSFLGNRSLLLWIYEVHFMSNLLAEFSNASVLLNMKIFVWKLAHELIPSKVFLMSRHMNVVGFCRNCPEEVWKYCHATMVPPTQDNFIRWSWLKENVSKWGSLLLCILWELGCNRNKGLFQGVTIP
ncbi:hypothetical protein VNO78_24106 [Psophocarpus tetragonolobus]|uniref:Uncharacterized protein n=1 Tax=Psophocarpus tetragonolobus TaxID=3891 RepID=A0AAN9S4C1_PSOTE